MENLIDYSAAANGIAIGTCDLSLFVFGRGNFCIPPKIINLFGRPGSLFSGSRLVSTGGPLFFILLMVFFLSSTFLSHFKASLKEPIEARIHAKSGPRDIVQVGANGGAALIWQYLLRYLRILLIWWRWQHLLRPAMPIPGLQKLGSSAKERLVSLICRNQLAGTLRGVSPLGFLASLGGSAVVALTYGLYQFAAGNSGLLLWMQILMIAFGGLLGSILDSLMGAAIQAKYISHDTGELTEQPDHNNIPNQLVSGITFVNNDFVNFASSLLAHHGAAFCPAPVKRRLYRQ